MERIENLVLSDKYKGDKLMNRKQMKALRVSLGILAGTLFFCLLSCNRYAHEVLGPPVVVFSPLHADVAVALRRDWEIQEMDGADVSVSLSRMRRLVETHVWQDIDAVIFPREYVDPMDTIYDLRYTLLTLSENEWHLRLIYVIDCRGLQEGERSWVHLNLIAHGTYEAGVEKETEDQVLIFYTQGRNITFYHEDPYATPPTCPALEGYAWGPPHYKMPGFQERLQSKIWHPVNSVGFTAALDWSRAEVDLKTFFDSPLWTAEIGAPVRYTLKYTFHPRDHYSDRIEPPTHTLRLYSQEGHADLVLKRRYEVTYFK